MRSGHRRRTDLNATVRRVPGLRIAMTDGIELGAVAYLPITAAPTPAVLKQTPYTLGTVHEEGLFFAAHGFAFVGVDVRGRGESDGVFTPMADDGPDGRDVVAWVAAQDWCDGKVGMYGGSYSGASQWLTLAQRPPALCTIAPAAAPFLGVDWPRGGVPSIYELRWLEGVSGRVRYRELIDDTEQWNRHAAAGFASGDPDDVRRAAGLPDTRYAHQVFESLDWEAHGFVPGAEAFRDCDLPVLSTTGQYDSCMLGALWQHERYLRQASASARARSTLLIGPWDHGCESSSGPAHAADLQFGPDAAVDLRRLHLEWFDWVMGSGRRPAFLDVPVRYFVTGEERWRTATSLQETTRLTSQRFLVSAPPPNDVFHSGWIAPTPARGPDYRIDVDAGDMRTVEVELTQRPDAVPIGAPDGAAPFHDLFATVGGDQPTDQAFSVALEGQGVVYHSSIVGEPLAIVGRPRLRLQLSLETAASAVDIDLVALLHEVRDDASAILLSSDMRRLALDSARTDVELDSWRFTARVLEPSSRVRLTVRVAQSLWWARPPSAPAHAALYVHHGDGATPALWLPLGDPGVG